MTTTPKFTPGPWKIGFSDGSGVADDYRDCGAYLTTSPDDTPVVRGGTDDGEMAIGVLNPSDATLIASAPDLYAALSDMLAEASGNPKSCGHDFSCVCVGDKARAALAKARGEA